MKYLCSVIVVAFFLALSSFAHSAEVSKNISKLLVLEAKNFSSNITDYFGVGRVTAFKGKTITVKIEEQDATIILKVHDVVGLAVGDKVTIKTTGKNMSIDGSLINPKYVAINPDDETQWLRVKGIAITRSDSTAKEEGFGTYDLTDTTTRHAIQCDAQNIFINTSDGERNKMPVALFNDIPNGTALKMTDKNFNSFANISKLSDNVYRVVYRTGKDLFDELQLSWPECQTLYIAHVDSTSSIYHSGTLIAYRENINYNGFIADSLEKGVAMIQVHVYKEGDEITVNKKSIVGKWHKDEKSGKRIFSKGQDKYIDNAETNISKDKSGSASVQRGKNKQQIKDLRKEN